MLKGMRPAAQQVGGARGFLYQLAARRFWGHRLLLTALVLATIMSADVAHAAQRSVPPIIPGSSSSVPVYNIQAACREMASIPEAHLFGSGGPDATKLCVDDENRAREQLLERWARFKASDQAMCAGASRSGPVSPTYTELITCLEMTRDHYGSKTGEARQRAQSEPRESAAVGLSAPSPVVVVPAPPTPRSTESAQQVSALDQPTTPSNEKGVDTVADLNQTIESLRSDLASSARKIASLEKDKEDAERATVQAQQARGDAESAKQRIEEASGAQTIEPNAKNHGPAILAYTTVAVLIILLAIGAIARRRRAVGARPT